MIKVAIAAPNYAMNMDRLIYALEWKKAKSLDDADVLLFTGGADINPTLYGEDRHISTGVHPLRDAAELRDLSEFIEMGKKKLMGVCRGAQLLTARFGGKLIQDVTNHASGVGHQMHTVDGLIVNVNSYHHQMCLPKDSIPLGWAQHVARVLQGVPVGIQIDPADFVEPEAFRIVRDDADALCFQYHPEFGTMPKSGMDWTIDQVYKWIGD